MVISQLAVKQLLVGSGQLAVGSWQLLVDSQAAVNSQQPSVIGHLSAFFLSCNVTLKKLRF